MVSRSLSPGIRHVCSPIVSGSDVVGLSGRPKIPHMIIEAQNSGSIASFDLVLSLEKSAGRSGSSPSDTPLRQWRPQARLQARAVLDEPPRSLGERSLASPRHRG